MIGTGHPELSIRCQCELTGLGRSTFCYRPATKSPLNLLLMRLIDRQDTKNPFYGDPKMTEHLRRSGYAVNSERVRRLMRLMDIQRVHAKPRTSVAAKGHRVYAYLLRGLAITRPGQVWCADTLALHASACVTYRPMEEGFL